MSNSYHVSILDSKARNHAGRSSSHIVAGTAPLTASLLVSEAWSPTLYNNNNRRAAANFVEAYYVGIDVDEGTTLAQAIEACEGRAAIVATTKSHQKRKKDEPACDRFRIVCKLAEAVVTPEDYKATLLSIVSELGVNQDKQAKDAARWFIPCVEVVFDQLASGRPFEVAHAQPAAEAVMVTRPTSNAIVQGALSRATLQFLSMYKVNAQLGAPEGWHLSFIKAAMDMKEQGYSEEEAAELLATASPVGALDSEDVVQLADVFANRGGALDFRPAWPVMGRPGRDGSPAQPVPTAPENIMYLLKNGVRHEFYMNKRREVVYVKNENGVYKPLSDTLLSVYKTHARTHRLSAEVIYDAIIAEAVQNSFDPLLDGINQVKWDGKDRFQEFFETITLPEGTTEEQRAWYFQFLKRWVIAAINKAYRPGSENNVLVLQGAQAAGKSRWLKRLTAIWPEGFGEGHINPDSKDHELRHLDNFIWHVAELDTTTNRRETGALKDFFTKDVVNVRRPYAKLPTTGNSICSFCASVNSHDFLQDLTGNRRYLVIPVEDVNFLHTVDVMQLWAQARDLANSGFQYWYSREEIAEVNRLNERFLSKDDYLSELEGRLEGGTDELTLTEIVKCLPGATDIQLTKTVRSNVRTILEKCKIRSRIIKGVTKFLVNEKSLKIKADAGVRLTAVVKG